MLPNSSGRPVALMYGFFLWSPGYLAPGGHRRSAIALVLGIATNVLAGVGHLDRIMVGGYRSTPTNDQVDGTGAGEGCHAFPACDVLPSRL